MNLRRFLVLAALPAAVVAVAGCGGTTLQIQPAAAATNAASPSPGASGRCDATPWTGAISPQGRPDSLDAGDAGAVYVWHDEDGWHVRTTDARPV